MAFTIPQDPNQQQIPGQPTPQLGQAPIAAGGAGVAGASKAAATPGQNVPQQPSAQLSAYLAANQPQSTAFAQNIAGDLSAKTTNAAAGINPAVNTYTGNLYSVPTDANVNAAVAASPASLTSDQATTFQNELGAASKAPNSASTFETTQPYQDLSSNIQNVVGQSKLWNSGNSIPDLTAALSPYEQSGQTSGNTTLDALLLSQTPGAYSQIQGATAPAEGLQGQLDTGAKSADAALQSAIAADQAATPAAQGAGQTYATNLTNYLNSTLAANQAGLNTNNNLNNTISADLAAGNLTPADAQALNIPGGLMAALNALNPSINTVNADLSNPNFNPGLPSPTTQSLSNYLTQGTAPNLSLANTATPQNYTDIAALKALMGSGMPPLPIDSSTASQAGQGLNAKTPISWNYEGATQGLMPSQQEALALEQKLASLGNYVPPNYLSDVQNLLTNLDTLTGASPTELPAGYTPPPAPGTAPTPVPSPAPAPFVPPVAQPPSYAGIVQQSGQPNATTNPLPLLAGYNIVTDPATGDQYYTPTGHSGGIGLT